MNLADACPECYPGDHPAVTPLLVHRLNTGGLCAHYVCPVDGCGARWQTGWDPRAAGFPTEGCAA